MFAMVILCSCIDHWCILHKKTMMHAGINDASNCYHDGSDPKVHKIRLLRAAALVEDAKKQMSSIAALVGVLT